MDWTKENREKLRKALTSGFQSYSSLSIFVSDYFDDIQLSQIASSQATIVATDDLIQYFQERGEVSNLVVAIYKARPNNPDVNLLAEQCKCDPLLYSMLPISTEKIVGESDLKSIFSEDNQTSDLVIALFREGTSKEGKFRVYTKFCYGKNSPQTLGVDNQADDRNIIKKDEVSKYLEERINDAKKILIELSNGTHFELVIELFLPIDLLSSPLHQWYGQENKYLKLYPLVMGCSDRFISDEVSHSSFDLRNRLKKGWSRFQAMISDEKRLKISELTWLKSDDADMESLADFTGFCCSGNWLEAGEEYLEKWEELILSGIPLALWRCNTYLKREELTVFEHLINHNRFDFLMRIPIMRERQHKMKEDYVGVFYEDIDYLPDIPKQMKFPGT